MLTELLSRSAALFHDRTALVQGARSLSYSELLTAVETAGPELSRSGVAPGRTVALQMPNSIEFVVSLFAAGRLGAGMLLLDPALKAGEVDDYCLQAGAGVLLPGLEAAGRQGDGLRVRAMSAVEAPPAAASDPGAPPALCGGHGPLLLLSSGTTGRPRVVVESPEQAAAYVRGCSAACGYARDDRMLAVLPFFHAYGLQHVLLAGLAAGATVVIEPFSPRGTAECVERERITVLTGVPLMFQLMAQTRFAARPDFSSVRLAIAGGSALTAAVADRFRDKFGVPLGQSYGTTEAGMVCFASPHEQVQTPGWVGRPYPGVTVEVRDASGRVLGAGQTGEVCARGPANTSGYLGGPEAAAAQVFRGDCVATGDLGQVDEEGRVFLVGRSKPTLVVAGKKVSPTEVEACLRGHPCVADALVVGGETGDGDERVRAYVVAVGPVSALELQEFCGERLAAHKVPRQIVFVEDLSGGAMGKTQIKPPAARDRG